ncbi:MAG: hypothetical protein LBG80_11435 [Bacteroidales bacterium]|jgi:hypothetical protein|nr:hypothetical protein [Bacteroidales bacterium]
MKKAAIFIICNIILFSCKSDKGDSASQTGINVIIPNAIVTHPMVTREMREREHVIRSDTENVYQLQVSFDEGKSFQDIDFSQYTLLGKYTSGGGCKVNFERNVSKNMLDKQMIYSIQVKQYGLCEMLVESMNWVLISKLSNDYSVVFTVKESREDNELPFP